MGLEIQKKKDGSLKSKWWYGRYEVNSITKFANLGVEVKGKIPRTLRAIGDPLFERSRAQAQVALDGLISEAKSRKSAEKYLEDLYELKSGCELYNAPLTDMELHWDQLPTKKTRTPQWIKTQHSSLKKFREHIQKKHPQVTLMVQVTQAIAREWMRTYEKKGMGPETYNHKLNLFRSLFRASTETGVLRNPFEGIPTKKKNTVHRQPFTPEELNTILENCSELIRPVFITGMCTAMRRGDCCMLRWESVDLENGFITVPTSKTGEMAEIPLFPILRAEIEKQPRESQYIFPEAAAMYQQNASMLSHRFKRVLKDAEIQTRIKREGSERKACVKDFHSLRTTWITMALSAGVPMELVRRVTGHSTVNVVLKHYFRPGREVFRQKLESSLPQVLTGSPQALPNPDGPDPKEALLKLAEKANALERKLLVQEIRKLADQLAA
jgi:integrase